MRDLKEDLLYIATCLDDVVDAIQSSTEHERDSRMKEIERQANRLKEDIQDYYKEIQNG